MKTKILVLLAGVAVVTLSFTFATTSRTSKSIAAKTSTEDFSAPAGGIALEEK